MHARSFRIQTHSLRRHRRHRPLSHCKDSFIPRILGFRFRFKAGEITEKLKNQGALIFTDHGESNVQGADLVVYSSAVSQDNPELVAARRNGIPIATRAEVLGQLMKEFNHSIAVAGTHGKTTTTSMIALILENAGYDPTILTGGIYPPSMTTLKWEKVISSLRKHVNIWTAS